MAYSMDLRIRVVKAYEMGEGTQADIGRLFNLGVATVKRWIWRKASIGEPARLPRGGGNHRRIGQIGEVVLLGLLERTPDATLAELAEQYAWATQMPMNASVVTHSLKRLGITRKKRLFFRVNETATASRAYIRTSSKRFPKSHRSV